MNRREEAFEMVLMAFNFKEYAEESLHVYIFWLHAKYKNANCNIGFGLMKSDGPCASSSSLYCMSSQAFFVNII